jgi:hypothetical protein
MSTTRFPRLFVLGIGLLLGVLWPLSAHAATTVRQFVGRSIQANIGSMEPVGCLITYGFVVAVDGTGNGERGTSSSALVDIRQFDICANRTVYFASGIITLDPNDFKVQDLHTATLRTTITVTDEITEEVFPVTIDLTLSGTGPIRQDAVHTHPHGPGCSINQRFTGAIREATVTGTVSFPGTTLTAPFEGPAIILRSQEHTVIINCDDE